MTQKPGAIQAAGKDKARRILENAGQPFKDTYQRPKARRNFGSSKGLSHVIAPPRKSMMPGR